MKVRVISAIVALMICVPILLTGGIWYQLGVYVLSLLALKEFINIKQTKKEMPIFIRIISYIILSLIVLVNTGTEDMLFTIDFRVITALFLAMLIPVVLYHDRSLYSVNDGFYMIGGVFFLGISFHLLILLRHIDLMLLIYLLIITIITDTYAYITGLLIGKHKLLECVSPKKTWEGMIGGTIFGVLFATVFFNVVIDSQMPLYVIVLMTLFLSILGQFGDLVFSSIKRYFGKKDFSNIMPGHGGILDRFDSIIFVLLGFMFFIPLI